MPDVAFHFKSLYPPKSLKTWAISNARFLFQFDCHVGVKLNSSMFWMICKRESMFVSCFGKSGGCSYAVGLRHASCLPERSTAERKAPEVRSSDGSYEKSECRFPAFFFLCPWFFIGRLMVYRRRRNLVSLSCR